MPLGIHSLRPRLLQRWPARTCGISILLPSTTRPSSNISITNNNPRNLRGGTAIRRVLVRRHMAPRRMCNSTRCHRPLQSARLVLQTILTSSSGRSQLNLRQLRRQHTASTSMGSRTRKAVRLQRRTAHPPSTTDRRRSRLPRQVLLCPPARGHLLALEALRSHRAPTSNDSRQLLALLWCNRKPHRCHRVPHHRLCLRSACRVPTLTNL